MAAYGLVYSIAARARFVFYLLLVTSCVVLPAQSQGQGRGQGQGQGQAQQEVALPEGPAKAIIETSCV